MSNWLHKFESATDFRIEYEGESYTEPWASVITETGQVNYNRPLTINPGMQTINYNTEELPYIIQKKVSKIMWDVNEFPSEAEYKEPKILKLDSGLYVFTTLAAYKIISATHIDQITLNVTEQECLYDYGSPNTDRFIYNLDNTNVYQGDHNSESSPRGTEYYFVVYIGKELDNDVTAIAKDWTVFSSVPQIEQLNTVYPYERKINGEADHFDDMVEETIRCVRLTSKSNNIVLQYPLFDESGGYATESEVITLDPGVYVFDESGVYNITAGEIWNSDQKILHVTASNRIYPNTINNWNISTINYNPENVTLRNTLVEGTNTTDKFYLVWIEQTSEGYNINIYRRWQYWDNEMQPTWITFIDDVSQG